MNRQPEDFDSLSTAGQPCGHAFGRRHFQVVGTAVADQTLTESGVQIRCSSPLPAQCPSKRIASSAPADAFRPGLHGVISGHPLLPCPMSNH